MRIKNIKIILLVSLVSIILGSINVIATSDLEGDVYYDTIDNPSGTITGTTHDYEPYGDRDNVDITDVSSTVSGSDVTVSLTVKGNIITDNDNFDYELYIKAKGKSEQDYYKFWYAADTYGNGVARGSGDFLGYYEGSADFTVSQDGHTISYTFTDIETSVDYEPWGRVKEYLDYRDYTENQSGGSWLDYAPESYAPWYDTDDNGGDDTSDDTGEDGTTPKSDTPGFEIIALLVAICLALIMLMKRKTI